MRLQIPEQRWQDLSMDFIGELPFTPTGNNYLMVVCDRLTKMTHLIPTLTTASAEQCAVLFFNNVFKIHGLPDSIVSDRDSRFCSKFWKALMQLCNTGIRMSTAYHPQTDGQTERTNRTIEEVLRHHVNSTQNDWDEHLTHVEFALNSSWHESIKSTPFYLNYGFHPRVPLSSVRQEVNVPAACDFVQHMQEIITKAKQSLQAAQQRQKHFADTHRKEVIFNVGDKVLLETKNIELRTAAGSGHKKLLPRWLGPFEIIAKVGTVAYKLKLPAALKIHPVFHVSLLKAYKSSGRVQPPPVPSNLKSDEDQIYEVERILDDRVTKAGKKEFLIKWAFYGPENNSWEPMRKLTGCPEALAEYWHMKALKETTPFGKSRPGAKRKASG